MPRPVASRRPRDPPMFSRLSSHDSGDGLAHVHGIGIHDPCHHLLVGAHVGRWHVLLRPEKFDKLGGVAARDALPVRRVKASSDQE